jgi:hypothetical protein
MSEVNRNSRMKASTNQGDAALTGGPIMGYTAKSRSILASEVKVGSVQARSIPRLVSCGSTSSVKCYTILAARLSSPKADTTAPR